MEAWGQRQRHGALRARAAAAPQQQAAVRAYGGKATDRYGTGASKNPRKTDEKHEAPSGADCRSRRAALRGVGSAPASRSMAGLRSIVASIL